MVGPSLTQQSRPIRVLIVDDSPMIRDILAAMLTDSETADIEVIGQAGNGEEAIRMTLRLQPDILLMDIRMPVLDGLEATRQIMRVHPTPILVVASSVYATDYNIAFNAIEAGALTVIEKPKGLITRDYDAVRDQLINAVKIMSGVKVLSRKDAGFGSSAMGPMTAMLNVLITRPLKVIAIASSTGGPAVLKYLLSSLPGDFSVPIVVVQHALDAFMDGLADWLSKTSSLMVKVAEDREKIFPGRVYLAPGAAHLTVVSDGILRVDPSGPYKGYRPSANRLFQSVSEVYGRDSVGIILTGMGDDGVEGLLALGKTGAHIIAQDKDSCVVHGMPKEAVDRGAVDEVLTPREIVSRLIKLDKQKQALGG